MNLEHFFTSKSWFVWAAVLLAVNISTNAQQAYRQQVITPHVTWVEPQSAPMQVLCLVNNLAAREPAELAQRFGFMDAVVVPVNGTAYKNQFDETFLTEALASDHYDALVIAASQVWRDLSPAAQALLQQKVSDGLPLLLVGRTDRDLPDWWQGKTPAGVDLTDAITTRLPVDPMAFRGGLSLKRYDLGSRHLYHLRGFTSAFILFTAFAPMEGSYFRQPLTPELGYATVARALQLAVNGQTHSVQAQTIVDDNQVGLELKLDQPLKHSATLVWSVLSPYAQVLATHQQSVTAGTEHIHVMTDMARDGLLLLNWSLVTAGDRQEFGAVKIDRTPAVHFQPLTPPAMIEPNTPLTVSYTLSGLTDAQTQVLAQVYDPEGRLISISRGQAQTDGQIQCSAWQPTASTFELRLVLMRGQRILDEQRMPVHVRLDRSKDLGRFHVIVWATEHGSWVERPRYELFGKLGVTSLATISKNRPNVSQMASEQGLRLVPTNVLVPPNRFTNTKTYNMEKDQQQLGDYAKAVAKFSPLGYSLADEPNTNDYVGWRDSGASIIQPHDPGVRVGYCGVKLNRDDDVPGFFQACDFLEMYSPKNLYTPNLWLGVERDLFRSFRREDAIVTCWTHYAPRLDHEPYSRTVPWLWLFEGLDGVSYFDSAGAFAILNPDLTTTHETRWWSQEIGKLNAGIAEQLLSMRRQTGVVRILWRRNSRGLDDWARALNQAAIPYRFTTVEALANDRDTSLVICPGTQDLTTAQSRQMSDFVSNGGTLLAVLPLAEEHGDNKVLMDLLGFNPLGQLPTDSELQAKAIMQHAGVPVELPQAGTDQPLTGQSSGAFGIGSGTATVISTFTRLGSVGHDDKQQHPAYINQLFATPAILTHKFGKGHAVCLTFEPDTASASRLIAAYGPPPSGPRVSVNHFNAPVYLYPFYADADVQLLGVIADYWAAGPDQELDGDPTKVVQTQAYFQHGRYRWQPRDAKLSLPQARDVYDVRNGRYLGNSREIAFQLDPTCPTLLSLLPYQVRQLTLTAPGSVSAGTTFNGRINLDITSGKPGLHVVHLTLEPPAQCSDPAQSHNVHLSQGAGSFAIAMPYNATPGTWKLTAADTLTGTKQQATIQVQALDADTAQPVLTPRTTQVRHIALDWPRGNWIDANTTQNKVGVNVKVSPIKRAIQHHIGGHKGQWALSANFSLANPLIKYRIKYQAVNDAKANHWKDERRIAAPYLPGLGFADPQPHMWYANGYLNVYFDDKLVTEYRISRLEKISDGDQGRVELTWDTPYGKIDLAFVLLPDDMAMFQEMVIHPTVRFNTLKLVFRSYPQGFGAEVKGTRGLCEIDPKQGAWALLGNRDLDPAYGKGMGSGAILVLPENWQKLEFGKGMVGARLERIIDPSATPLTRDAPELVQAGQALPDIHARWALWMFPEMGNNEALQYMDVHATQTRQQLLKLFPKSGE